jgi:3-hydroxybutyryl-CoA dehydrogenase
MTTDKKAKLKKKTAPKPAPTAASSKTKKGAAAVKSVPKTKSAKSVKSTTPPAKPVNPPASKKSAAPVKKPVKRNAPTPTVAPSVVEPIVIEPVTTEPLPPVEAAPAAETIPVAPVETIQSSEEPVTPATDAPAAESVPPVPEATHAINVEEPAPAPPVKKGKKAAAVPPAAPSAVPTPLAAEPKPVTEAKPVKHLVCLLGDEGLVKEYSAMFQDRGIAVLELKSLASLKNSAKKITAAFELTLLANESKSKNLQALDEALPENVPVASCSITSTLLVQTHTLKHRHRFVGIAAFPTLTGNSLLELAPSLHTTKAAADGIADLLGLAKKETAMVQDSVGMVMPRILCQIVNEALFTVQNDVATPHDIDEAMKHGTNYPHGPIAWGESIGFGTVVSVLDALYENHHEERYRVAPLLRQLAVAGVFWEKKKES